jgi:hypothetical protein
MQRVGEQCYAAWAPDESPWAPWAKPILFQQMVAPATPDSRTGGVIASLPSFDAFTALVVDVAGARAVHVGLDAAWLGWRPVPLFNATNGPKPVVDATPVADALLTGGEKLAGLDIRAEAPPAFLLDARRMEGAPSPGSYDNRWVTLPQDFPSATFLRSRGITRAVLIQDSARTPKEDLSHVLLRWKEGGIELRWLTLQDGGTGELQVSPPSYFRKAWYRVMAMLNLRRNDVGGFGGPVPEASAGGGYG